jgi:hypothetical protein
MVNYFVKYTVDKYVDDQANDIVPTCKEDIELAFQDRLKEGDDAGNFALLKEYRYNHPNIWRSADTVGKIDIVLERGAFGKDASPAGRVKAYRVYGADLFEQRRLAWGASEGTIRSGTEPGKSSEDVVRKAEKIVAAEDANNPFNPKKRYLTEETRINDITKFINHFGTKAAQAACAKFQVDIAGRPLPKRA